MYNKCHRCANVADTDETYKHFKKEDRYDKKTSCCIICDKKSRTLKYDYCKNCIILRDTLCVHCIVNFQKNQSMVFNCDICNEETNISVAFRGLCQKCSKNFDVQYNESCKGCRKTSLNDGFCASCKPYRCEKCFTYCTIFCVRFAGNIECNECYELNDNKIDCSTLHNKCFLDNKCCLCRDKRICNLKNVGYDGYIDGIGFVKNKDRWDFYCQTCRSYYESVCKDITNKINV
jgi:hypothetical protein